MKTRVLFSIVLVALAILAANGIAYAIDSTTSESRINLFHDYSQYNIPIEKYSLDDHSKYNYTGGRYSFDEYSPILGGYFSNSVIGCGFTLEDEWAEKTGEKRSFIINAGIRYNKGSYKYEYSCGINYLFHNHNDKCSFINSYKGLSLTLIESHPYIGFPLGVRVGTDRIHIYAEAMPIISDTCATISFGYAIRMDTFLFPAIPAYGPIM